MTMAVTMETHSNSSNETSVADVPVPFVILMRSQGSIIVILNIIVVTALAVKKRKFPAIYWLQIVFLALNDILAGIATIVISFIDLDFFTEDLENCCSAFIFLAATQLASLFNILGICVQRFIVLKRADLNASVWTHKHTIVCNTVAWTVSLIFCILPVALYNKGDYYYETKLCSMKPIFGEDDAKGMTILFGSFLLPLLFTNVLYVILFWFLRRKLKKVKPIVSRGQTQADTSVLHSEVTSHFPETPVQKMATITLSSASTSQQREHINQNLEIEGNSNKQVCARLNVPKNSVIFSSFIKPGTKPQQSKNTSSDVESTSGNGLNQERRRHIPGVILRQRKAFKLLGIILLCLNIFTWPAVAAIVLSGMSNSNAVDRSIRLPMFTIICLNSAVNPVVYAATLPEFRAALLEIVNSIYVKCKQ